MSQIFKEEKIKVEDFIGYICYKEAGFSKKRPIKIEIFDTRMNQVIIEIKIDAIDGTSVSVVPIVIEKLPQSRQQAAAQCLYQILYHPSGHGIGGEYFLVISKQATSFIAELQAKLKNIEISQSLLIAQKDKLNIFDQIIKKNQTKLESLNTSYRIVSNKKHLNSMADALSNLLINNAIWASSTEEQRQTYGPHAIRERIESTAAFAVVNNKNKPVSFVRVLNIANLAIYISDLVCENRRKGLMLFLLNSIIKQYRDKYSTVFLIAYSDALAKMYQTVFGTEFLQGKLPIKLDKENVLIFIALPHQEVLNKYHSVFPIPSPPIKKLPFVYTAH